MRRMRPVNRFRCHSVCALGRRLKARLSDARHAPSRQTSNCSTHVAVFALQEEATRGGSTSPGAAPPVEGPPRVTAPSGVASGQLDFTLERTEVRLAPQLLRGVRVITRAHGGEGAAADITLSSQGG